MKISETKVDTKQFEPITLNITFETREELEYFYGMTNASIATIKEWSICKCQVNKWDDNRLEVFQMQMFWWANNKLEGLK
ncbi:MAG: hypothetical protein WC055_00705 [Melioribacteraceae bacterium]